MRKRALLSTVTTLVSALAITTFSTGSAQADGYSTPNCGVDGANGGAVVQNWTALHADIEMNVYDTRADGHHVAIRFLSQEVGHSIHYWPWHHNYKGNGESVWVKTTASNQYGDLNYTGVEVAVMEGSTVLYSCLNWG